MKRHPEVPYWLCVGDVADAEGRYEPLPARLYWIKGNNENFDTIAAGAFPDNLHYIPNAAPIDLGGLRIVGLGGTHAPKWYDTPAADLPHKPKDDKRRHFVGEEVEACRGLKGIDIFLSHEAPRPFRVARGIDAGKTPINEVLAAMRPRLHLFGHHHAFRESVVQQVRSVCLDPVGRSYLLIDPNTLEYQHLPVTLGS